MQGIVVLIKQKPLLSQNTSSYSHSFESSQEMPCIHPFSTTMMKYPRQAYSRKKRFIYLLASMTGWSHWFSLWWKPSWLYSFMVYHIMADHRKVGAHVGVSDHITRQQVRERDWGPTISFKGTPQLTSGPSTRQSKEHVSSTWILRENLI
jgi:hypothetical protein